MPYQFDKETDSTQLSVNHWQLNLVSDWNIGNNPNGGYLLACLLRTMAKLVPDTPDPLAISTHYLRPGLGNQRADLHANIMRQGRRTATVTGTLEQEGKPRVTCTATFGQLSQTNTMQDNRTERNLSMPAIKLPPPDECVSRTELAQGVTLPIMNRLDIRVDPKYANLGIHNEALLTGWIRFGDLREPDLAALPLFCDAFPPSIFTLYGQIGWVPTLELSVYFRQQPEPGWIKGVFKTNDLAGELFIEDAALWDENDRLVCQSRQLQMILN